MDKKMARAIGIRVGIIAAIIIALFIISGCAVVTYPDQYTVIQQFGEIKSIRSEPGLSFKVPFVQTVRQLPKSVQLYDIPISDVITKDKKTMVTDSFVLWKVTEPKSFVKELNASVSVAETRIGNLSYNSMKNVISSLPQSDIISGRDQLAEKIFANIGDLEQNYGVNIVGIETKSLDLPDANKESVYGRMISERNNIAASYQAEGEEEGTMIRSNVDKEVSIQISKAKAEAATVRAEGESEYMKILNESYEDPAKADFYQFVRSLEMAKTSYSGGNTTLVIPPDSPLADVFYNAG